MIKKIILLSCISLYGAHAKVNFDLAIARNTNVSVTPPLILEPKQVPTKVLHDDTTYIEVELLDEKNDTVQLRFTVATKSETGAFIVRGLPQLHITMHHGMGMGTLQCEGRGESFTLIIAVSPLK